MKERVQPETNDGGGQRGEGQTPGRAADHGVGKGTGKGTACKGDAMRANLYSGSNGNLSGACGGSSHQKTSTLRERV